MKVLLLAGTAEARELSQRLAGLADIQVVVSLAGRTSTVADHGGTVRVGGFHGVDGLARHLVDEGFDAIVDATHPFAETMSTHAATAAERVGVRRLRFERPPWRAQAGDRWTEVSDLAEASMALPALGATRVLLTIGRTGLDAFADIGDVQLVVRSIETVDRRRLPGAVLLEARGPFAVSDELRLLERYDIDAVVTKNSGGDDSKLVAARVLGIHVVMIKRPPCLPGTTVGNLDDAVRWLRSVEAR